MQEKVSQFVEQYGLTADAQSRYIDFMSEAGQLGKAILNASDYGTRPLEVSDEIVAEAGDCLFSLLALFNEFGLEESEVLQAVLTSYDARMKQYAASQGQRNE